jgi:hypothetical protein
MELDSLLVSHLIGESVKFESCDGGNCIQVTEHELYRKGLD